MVSLPSLEVSIRLLQMLSGPITHLSGRLVMLKRSTLKLRHPRRLVRYLKLQTLIDGEPAEEITCSSQTLTSNPRFTFRGHLTSEP